MTSPLHPVPASDPQTRKVADSIAATLAKYGVRYAFGIPGNDVLELVRACEEHGIEFVLAKTEPAAAFMADAVYQLTGRPAVMIVAFGPGMSNAGAGLASATMERSAMLVLCGELATNRYGIYNHQAFDHLAFAAPLTKLAAPLNPERAAQQTARALDVALAYPAGPVMINCPANLTRAGASQDAVFEPRRSFATILSETAAADARSMIEAAGRPLALIGRGTLHDGITDAVGPFIEGWGLPFLTTYKVKGIVDERHPLCLGSVGLSPVVDTENLGLIEEADLMVLVGFDPIELRDAWLDAWPEDRPCLTIDHGPQTHRIFPVGRQALGDVGGILRQLTPSEQRENNWPEERLTAFKDAVAHIVRPRESKTGISPAALFKTVGDMAGEDWILTVDVGAHRILANHVIDCRRPGQLMQSNGLGCMGYAIPAAVGAQLVHPDRPVVALVGDGCALMTLGELGIAAERDQPLVVVVLNDATLALIKLKQNKMQLDARGVDFGDARFDRIGEGFGAHGLRVDTLEAFTDALRGAVAERRFTVIDAVIDPAEYWEQM